MTTISAKTILRSRNASAPEKVLSTLLLRYPRFIHAELLTHRSFCLAGDARLDFDLPSKAKNGSRRIHSMSIKEFVEKWENGAAKGRSPQHNGVFLNLPSRSSYSAREIATLLGFKNATNLNGACRKGLIADAKKLTGQWVASADAWEQWRNGTGQRRFSITKRLAAMSIRQLDEKDGRVRLSSVIAVQRSGVKPVFVLRTRNYEVAGSADHLVFTDRGWVRIGDLIVSKDKVATYKYGTGLQEDPFRKINGKWVSRWNRVVRKDVAARQDGRCAETGEMLEDDFHIHHIQPRHKRPDLAFDIDNVVAVNTLAHKALHGIQGWQEGVPLQSGFEMVEAVESRGHEETFDIEIAGEFPNFFANGIVVHNSRNAASSRAIPVKKMIDDILADTAMPIFWGKNQKGMQAWEEFEGFEGYVEDPWHPKHILRGQILSPQQAWCAARDKAIDMARSFEKTGYHKQVVNRLLEPFLHITVLVSATEWGNFLELRDHEDAEPHIRMLAQEIRACLDDESTVDELNPGEWHLPFVGVHRETQAGEPSLNEMIKLSVARCASTSFKTVDGFDMTLERAIEVHDKLVGSRPIHASPCEHVAQADEWNAVQKRDMRPKGWQHPQQHGNFIGFRQYRHMLSPTL